MLRTGSKWKSKHVNAAPGFMVCSNHTENCSKAPIDIHMDMIFTVVMNWLFQGTEKRKETMCSIEIVGRCTALLKTILENQYKRRPALTTPCLQLPTTHNNMNGLTYNTKCDCSFTWAGVLSEEEEVWTSRLQIMKPHTHPSDYNMSINCTVGKLKLCSYCVGLSHARNRGPMHSEAKNLN